MRTSLLIASLLVACGSRPSDPDAGRDASRSLDCLALIDCLSACGDDEVCNDACIAQASPEALAEAGALVTCFEASGCTDDPCLVEVCNAELVACDAEPMIHEDAGVPDAPGGDAPSDVLPVRIAGTTRDRTDALGAIYDSVGDIVFVRDDAAGEAAGYPIHVVAFYRVESLSYTITVSGSAAGCSYSADESFVPTENDPFENYLLIERAPASDRLHPYGLATAAAQNTPDAVSITCPGVGTSHSDLSTGHYVAHGIDEPHSDLRTFVGDYTRGGRVSSWDLRTIE